MDLKKEKQKNLSKKVNLQVKSRQLRKILKENFGDKVTIVGKYKVVKGKIKTKTKYGEHISRVDELKIGCFPSIQTAINKTEYFINKANEVHGSKYDYSESIYVGSREKMKIICPIHGEFFQSYHDHVNKRCP